MNCKQCNTVFEITDSDRQFYEKVSPVFNGQKYLIPEPDHCPNCRQISRMMWRNERTLYKRKCDKCQKPIISSFAPNSPYLNYCYDCWWGDGWSALDYGRDFDFSRPFFEQFDELMKATPQMALLNFQVENGEYNNCCNESKNIHLCFASGYAEDCMYLDWSYKGKNTFDCSYCTQFELDYMNVECTETYHCKFCKDCHSCSDCEYSFDLRNCQSCFGCVGLRNKQYHVFNKPYSKEEYEQMLPKLRDPANRQRVLDEVKKLKSAHPHQASRILNSENCTGDYINNSKNSHECYNVSDMQDCKYMYDVFDAKDCMDSNRSGSTELTYFTGGGGYHKNTQFTVVSVSLNFSMYSTFSFSSTNIFGCSNVKHGQNVILNKQYTKEEYETLVPKIIDHMKETGEWGQFFPAEYSPFAYNEAISGEFFPLTKEECLAQGYRWKDSDQKEFLAQTVQVSADISQVPDSITNEVLACEVTGRNFKITPQELKFYRQEGLPIPSRHPDQRYRDRLAQKNPRTLYDRTCASCQVAISTTYAPDRPEKVYCEQCYLKEVY